MTGVDIAALRATATAQHYSSQDIHGVSVKPSEVLALVEAVEAALSVHGHGPTGKAPRTGYCALCDALAPFRQERP